ncbi:MAG: hypothetical protein ABFR36_07850 [Acidobacteriota bacterium]
MTNFKTLLIFLSLIVFIIPFSGFGSQSDYIGTLLGLSEDQVERLDEIKKNSEIKEGSDREKFKDDPLILIEAAKKRRQITDSLIVNMLGPEQKMSFERYMAERDRDHELFILTEGLLLSEVQKVRVKIILDEFREMMESKMEIFRNRAGFSGGSERGRPGGMRGGPGMSGGKPGGMGRPGGGRPVGASNPISELDSKKAKRIKKLLTKEQKKMYKKIRKKQRKEIRQRIKEMREEMGM